MVRLSLALICVLGLCAGGLAAEEDSALPQLQWESSLEAGLAKAQARDQLLLVHLYDKT